MISAHRFAGSFALAASLAVVAACSSSTTTTSGNGSSGTAEGDGGVPAPGDGGMSGSDSSSPSAAFMCCLNGQFFGCPDKAALDKCAGGGAALNECMLKCMGNPTCVQGCQSGGAGGAPDTSACTRTASHDSECTPTCAGVEHVTTDKSCSNNAGCTSSEHCFGGKCYLSSAGAPCSSTSECGNVAQCNSGCCEL